MKRTPLRRKKPLRAKTRIRRRRRISKFNAKRQAKLKLIQFGPKERRRFVRRLSCIVPGCNGRAQNAHTPSIGAGGVATDISPICALHHHEQHTLGIGTWSRKYGLDVEATNAATEAAWQRECARRAA